MMKALNRVAKWRRVFTGKMIGTGAEDDPLIVGMNDLQEARIVMRVELTALTDLLLKKGVFTQEQFADAMEREANTLNSAYTERFPGFEAQDDGMHMTMPAAMETMRKEPWAK